MKRAILFLIVSLILTACGDDNKAVDRPGSNGSGTSGGAGTTDAEQNELNDETVRFSCGDITLKFGAPGVLYTKDADGTTLSLIDISTDRHVKFNIREGDLYIDGTNVANNIRPIKRDNSKGLTWYYGIHKSSSEKFYLVIEDY